jgi:hypothetical protein
VALLSAHFRRFIVQSAPCTWVRVGDGGLLTYPDGVGGRGSCRARRMGAPFFAPCEGWGTERISGSVMRSIRSPPLLRTARMGHPRSTNSVMVGRAHPTRHQRSQSTFRAARRAARPLEDPTETATHPNAHRPDKLPLTRRPDWPTVLFPPTGKHRSPQGIGLLLVYDTVVSHAKMNLVFIREV